MKKAARILGEAKGDKAHKEAIAMGLKYKGFGYWVDAQGNVTHKTENDTLVPVEPEQFSDKAEKGNETAGMAPSGGFGNPEGVGASFNTFQNKQNPMGTGTQIQGVADTGLAQAPNRDNKRWEPGPDGDNFVTTQELDPRNKPPSDSFVGKTNYYAWTAGADGTNYTNLSFQDMLNKAKGMTEELSHAGMGRETMVNKLKQPAQPGDGNTLNDARAALQKANTRTREQALASVARTNPASTGIFGNDREVGDYTKALKADRKIRQLPLSIGDKSRVNDMNEAARGLVQDPNFDMSRTGEQIGDGSFGEVFLSEDGKNVIKKGQIGPAELMALHKMRDNPAFPNLINAQFNTPFRDQSYAAAMADGRSFDPDRSRQYDPADVSDWDQQYPTAEGTFAMSKASGIPLFDAMYEWSPEQKQEALADIWRTRAQMHMAGLAHNDMHGGNMFWDPETGKVNMLDMGMAQDNPMAALLEAFGGVTDEDYQLSNQASLMNFEDTDVRQGFKDRMFELQQELEDEMAGGLDVEDEEGMDIRDRIGDLFRGGIRMKDSELKQMQEMFPNLDGSRIKKMLKHLYGSFGKSELENRMSDAFDQRKADTRKVALANVLRKSRGEPEIEVKNPNVIPPKNMIMDPDD